MIEDELTRLYETRDQKIKRVRTLMKEKNISPPELIEHMNEMGYPMKKRNYYHVLSGTQRVGTTIENCSKMIDVLESIEIINTEEINNA